MGHNVRVQHDATYRDKVYNLRINGHQAELPTALNRHTTTMITQELKERSRAITQLARERVKEEKSKQSSSMIKGLEI